MSNIDSMTGLRRFGALSLLAVAAVTAWAQPPQGAVPRTPGQNPNGMHVYIWGGLKSHGPGQHDYPQFLADWSKLLTEHGAVVGGSLQFPSAADLQGVDVVIIYKGDAGYLNDAQKAVLEAYVKRGGGLVNMHDSLCGPDPAYFAQFLGAAKKHGETNFTLEAPIHYDVVDKENPIMKDMTDLTILDEAFFLLTMAKEGVHPLANVTIPATRSAGEHKGEVVPQIWTYEHTAQGGTAPSRAFVWMQGHQYSNFENYQIQRTLLRGIAWAGKKPVDELVSYVAPPRPAGGRGGQGAPGAPGGGGRAGQ